MPKKKNKSETLTEVQRAAILRSRREIAERRQLLLDECDALMASVEAEGGTRIDAYVAAVHRIRNKSREPLTALNAPVVIEGALDEIKCRLVADDRFSPDARERLLQAFAAADIDFDETA